MLTVRYRTIIILVIFTALLGAEYASASPEMAPSTVQPIVAVKVFNISTKICKETPNYTEWFKLGDLTTFNVHSSGSVVELVFEGHVYAESSDNSFIIFELRVDDSASTYGWARTYINISDWDKPIFSSITGIFSSLSPGQHTISMWVGFVYFSIIDHPCVNPENRVTDHLIVKEYTPFGFTYLPVLQR